MKIIFASNANFGKITMEEAIWEGIRPSLVVTVPDKKMDRGQKEKASSIKKWALRENLPIKEADTALALDEIVRLTNPDIVVVAALGIVISPKTLSMARFINIHPSLLPKYRGATPIQHAIISGEKESGVSLIFMDERIDHGPIISQTSVPFHEKITYKEAEEILAKKGGELLRDTLFKMEKGEEVITTPQDHAHTTYTKMFEKEDGHIDWSEPALIIERKIRALNPWPGTFCKADNKTIKILKADVQKQTEHGPFGTPGKTFLGTNDTIAVQTGEDFLLIGKLQLEGKRPVSAKDFLQGNMDFIGSLFS